jgi:hypothetical protein
MPSESVIKDVITLYTAFMKGNERGFPRIFFVHGFVLWSRND